MLKIHIWTIVAWALWLSSSVRARYHSANTMTPYAQWQRWQLARY